MNTVEERFLILSFMFAAVAMLLATGVALAPLLMPILSGQEELDVLWQQRLIWRYGLLMVLVMGGLGILLPLGQVLLFRNLVARPLKDLARAASVLDAEGLPLQAPVHRPDEIGDVAVAYNDMVKSLKDAREKAMLKERLAALGELSAGILHEIRNPLAAIVGYCDLLDRDLGSQPERDLLAKVKREAVALTDLSNRFLSFAKPLHMVPEAIAVKDLLLEVGALLQGLSASAHCQVEVECPEDLPSLIADRASIRQCLLDLGQNGIEAMEQGGRLLLSARPEKDRMLLEVEDEGKGMSEEEASKAFDPFYTQKEDGTGLGLAMVFRMIEAHHGTVKLQSQPGQGTQATISLKLESLP